MYIPGPFNETDEPAIWAMVERAPFALLITHGPEGVQATHIPFLVDSERCLLAGHIARANPQPAVSGIEALVVFTGPNAYVSPNWYPTKARNGRAVPTWNYEAVHIHGRLSWRDEGDWKRTHLSAMSERFEGDFEQPWRLDDAPEDYVQAMFRGVIGVEIAIERIEAKRKLSQNQPEENRLGAVAGLEATGEAGAARVAALMRDLKS